MTSSDHPRFAVADTYLKTKLYHAICGALPDYTECGRRVRDREELLLHAWIGLWFVRDVPEDYRLCKKCEASRRARGGSL